MPWPQISEMQLIVLKCNDGFVILSLSKDSHSRLRQAQPDRGENWLAESFTRGKGVFTPFKYLGGVLKMKGKISALILAVIIGFVLVPPAFAGVTVGDNLTLFGDLRYRAEYDTRESKDRTRDRQRLRARFGAKYKVDDNWSMGFRFRTGDPANNGNSPHQTLGGGDPVSAGFDRAYIKYKAGPFSAWAGKIGRASCRERV